MSEWVGVHQAARIAKCVIYTIRKHARKGNIRSKYNPENRSKKIYNVEDIRNLNINGRQIINERINTNKKENKTNKNKLPSKCKNCIWRKKGTKTCMFRRCVKLQGWYSEKKEGEINEKS